MAVDIHPCNVLTDTESALKPTPLPPKSTTEVSEVHSLLNAAVGLTRPETVWSNTPRLLPSTLITQLPVVAVFVPLTLEPTGAEKLNEAVRVPNCELTLTQTPLLAPLPGSTVDVTALLEVQAVPLDDVPPTRASTEPSQAANSLPRTLKLA